MAKVGLSTIKNWFRTGDTPTEVQFSNVFDSFRHKDQTVEIVEVNNLQGSLDNKVDKASMSVYLKETNVDDSTIEVDGAKRLKVKDGGILAIHIHDGSVNETKLSPTERASYIYNQLRGGNGAEYSTLKKVYDLIQSIPSAKLPDDVTIEVYQNKLRVKPLSIDTAQIKDNAITTAKLDNSEKSTTIYNTLRGGVDTVGNTLKKLYDKIFPPDDITLEVVSKKLQIKNRGVGLQHLANNSVSERVIQDGVVTNAKLANLTVDTGKIKDNAITDSKIRQGAVTRDKIANGSINNDKISASAVGTNELVSTERASTIYNTLRDGVAVAGNTLKKLYDLIALKLNISDKASTSDISTGTDDAKYITSKGLKDSGHLTTGTHIDSVLDRTKTSSVPSTKLTTDSLEIVRLLNNNNAQTKTLSKFKKYYAKVINSGQLTFALPAMNTVISGDWIEITFSEWTQTDRIDISGRYKGSTNGSWAKGTYLGRRIKLVADKASGGTNSWLEEVIVEHSSASVQVDDVTVNKDSSGRLQIKPSGVDTGQINNDAVTRAKIQNDAISSGKIADNAVIESKIAGGAVTTNKIGNGQVTEAKLENSQKSTTIYNTLRDGVSTVGNTLKKLYDLLYDIPDKVTLIYNRSSQLSVRDSGIDTLQIKDDAVSEDKIKFNSVGPNQIKLQAVQTEKIEDNAVTSAKLVSSERASTIYNTLRTERQRVHIALNTGNRTYRIDRPPTGTTWRGTTYFVDTANNVQLIIQLPDINTVNNHDWFEITFTNEMRSNVNWSGAFVTTQTDTGGNLVTDFRVANYRGKTIKIWADKPTLTPTNQHRWREEIVHDIPHRAVASTIESENGIRDYVSTSGLREAQYGYVRDLIWGAYDGSIFYGGYTSIIGGRGTTTTTGQINSITGDKGRYLELKYPSGRPISFYDEIIVHIASCRVVSNSTQMAGVRQITVPVINNNIFQPNCNVIDGNGRHLYQVSSVNQSGSFTFAFTNTTDFAEANKGNKYLGFGWAGGGNKVHVFCIEAVKYAGRRR